MRILVLNSGSSSLKFALMEDQRSVARGLISKIGHPDAALEFDGKKTSQSIPDHEAALRVAFECLKRSGAGGEEIAGVGHRVVHGGEEFRESVIFDDDVARRIEGLNALAPLHNPHNLKGYAAARALLPHAVHVAVFDTAFHHTLPLKAFLYGLPYESYAQDKIRRYGFHGTSHRYLAGRFAELRGGSPESFKLITCHLGNGCSVCAIDGGRSVDTSMGFTPLEGLLMGTRCGDLDPGAVLYLAQHPPRTAAELDELFNESSGLLGLSGVSNDMQEVLNAAQRGNARAEDAIQVFCYRVTKYIGAYVAVLGGADALIFAGGIGEHAASIRARICEPLTAFGITLDAARNSTAVAKEASIGPDGARPEVWVIPTNEELMIARDTARLIREHSRS